jgi:hypothetical protein
MFESKNAFEVAEILYCKSRMSAGNIDDLLQTSLGEQVPFSNHKDLYAAIDGISAGDVPWQSFLVQHRNGLSGDADATHPKWMLDVHEVFYRDPRLILHMMLANPDFKSGMDFSPYRAFDGDGVRRYQHMMSGDWAWNQAVSHLVLVSGRLDVWTHRASNVGCDSSRPKDARSNVCSHHLRKRQDNGVSGNRPYRVLSSVFVIRKSSQ